MKDLALKIAGSILRSLFVSIIFFVVGFSLVTGEFPPDLKRIPRLMDQVQKLTQVSREVHEKQKLLKSKMATQGYVEDQDVAALEELQLKRAEIGVAIGSGKELPQQEVTERADSSGEVYQLRARVNELEMKVLKMQSQMDRMEANSSNPQ